MGRTGSPDPNRRQPLRPTIDAGLCGTWRDLRPASGGRSAPAPHGAIMARASRAVHRTMVRGVGQVVRPRPPRNSLGTRYT